MSIFVNDFTDSVESYFEDIKDYDKLSKEKEQELFERYRKNGDNNAREELITSNLKFVVDIAKKYKGFGVPFPELISEGNMALTRAVDKFDTERGVRFITCAVWWIKHDIAEFIISNNKHEKVVKDSELMNNLYTDHIGEKKTVSEDMTEDTLFERFANKELVATLTSSLNERERNVIEMNFGLNGNSEMTLAEIGKELGLSRERVRQIKDEGLRKLRNKSTEVGIYSAVHA